MTLLHDDKNHITALFSKSLDENIDTLSALFENCADVVKRKFSVGGANQTDIFIIYIDNMIDKELLEMNTLLQLFRDLKEMPETDKFEYIKNQGIQTVDLVEVNTIAEIVGQILSGDTIILVDGYDKALKVSMRKMPNRGVPTSENEVSVRGSKESFSEALFINRVLLRRRIKDTNLKMKQLKIGTRTRTDVAVCYLEGVAKPEVLAEIERRLNEYVIDGILDSGMLEQLTERNTYSPFPEYQSTERPDKAAAAILDGRVVILVDNSPVVIVLPTTLNSFFQASDDAYTRWEVATFLRLLRYIGAFLTIALPGLYVAVLNYNAELLSPAMSLSFAAAREGVPFSVLVEVIIMEISFQMLLEAGVRMPGPMGGTLGIVGGLIIGDAAVNANIVSPIVVIVIALTAITAFTVPNEPFASAFRIIRYFILALSAFLGLFGFIIGITCLLIHLGGLKSFGMPYMVPFAASGINHGTDTKDAMLRFPFRKLRRRPLFASKDERTKLVKREGGKEMEDENED
ncbi:spore germination protein [Anaerocolumna xylanovorans]|uniref:Spore germination protein n=1 Tax=Anaerocolumna xylanovorans DSM 12503 TaxID=1121345 RepID=A0A1M7YLS2_9FIRM|nr:spore germination protein [Anaerocolumna xylanovorans]SHO53593.1 spore germination protein [Anaerocolumna xylanovorans DSM 12503]